MLLNLLQHTGQSPTTSYLAQNVNSSKVEIACPKRPVFYDEGDEELMELPYVMHFNHCNCHSL